MTCAICQNYTVCVLADFIMKREGGYPGSWCYRTPRKRKELRLIPKGGEV